MKNQEPQKGCLSIAEPGEILYISTDKMTTPHFVKLMHDIRSK